MIYRIWAWVVKIFNNFYILSKLLIQLDHKLRDIVNNYTSANLTSDKSSTTNPEFHYPKTLCILNMCTEPNDVFQTSFCCQVDKEHPSTICSFYHSYKRLIHVPFLLHELYNVYISLLFLRITLTTTYTINTNVCEFPAMWPRQGVLHQNKSQK